MFIIMFQSSSNLTVFSDGYNAMAVERGYACIAFQGCMSHHTACMCSQALRLARRSGTRSMEL